MKRAVAAAAAAAAADAGTGLPTVPRLQSQNCHLVLTHNTPDTDAAQKRSKQSNAERTTDAEGAAEPAPPRPRLWQPDTGDAAPTDVPGPVAPPPGVHASAVCDICGAEGAWADEQKPPLCSACRRWRRFPNVAGALNPDSLPLPTRGPK